MDLLEAYASNRVWFSVGLAGCFRNQRGFMVSSFAVGQNAALLKDPPPDSSNIVMMANGKGFVHMLCSHSASRLLLFELS